MSNFTEETFDAILEIARVGGCDWGDMMSLGNRVLLEAALGKLDLNMAARAILSCRGVGPEGKFVGFTVARQSWRARAHPGYAALARRGGSRVTDAKIAANRANAKKGGRHKKDPDQGKKNNTQGSKNKE
jgi:hypothetical protein